MVGVIKGDVEYVLGDTANGLTGREIATLLREARIDDPGEKTKKDRLFEAFSARQAHDNVANAVLACLKLALDPARFLDMPEAFESWRQAINEALAFVGLIVTEDGEVKSSERSASTLSEARARANRFREALRQRNVHHLVISGCASEIEDENYFHAVFETAKSLADRIRDLTGLTASLLHRRLDDAVQIPAHLRAQAA